VETTLILSGKDSGIPLVLSGNDIDIKWKRLWYSTGVHLLLPLEHDWYTTGTI